MDTRPAVDHSRDISREDTEVHVTYNVKFILCGLQLHSLAWSISPLSEFIQYWSSP